MAVYMIQGESRFGPVKIGHSHNPEVRLGQLQISHWEDLRIIRQFEGGEAEENALHLRFSDLYLRGEWHSFSRAMLGDLGLVEIFALPIDAPPPVPLFRTEASGYCKALCEWMVSNDMTLQAAGKLFGVAHTTVARWCAGEFSPSRAKLIVIREKTGGKVCPDDFVPAFTVVRATRAA